jgi:chitinase
LTLTGNQTTASTAPLNAAPPVANAGPSQTVHSLASVTLDGSATHNMVGSNAITYAWTQILGTTVTINNASSQTASFTAPSASSPIILGFQLTATTVNGSTSDQVFVAVGSF